MKMFAFYLNRDMISSVTGLERFTAERDAVCLIPGVRTKAQGLKITEKWRYCLFPVYD